MAFASDSPPAPRYENALVGAFAVAALMWALVAACAGLAAGGLLLRPEEGAGEPAHTYARMAPVFWNLLLFGFLANAVFAGVIYSTQRLCQAPLASGALGWLQWAIWQGGLGAGVVALAEGATQGRLLAELEWTYDLALGAAWLLYAINVFGTIAMRRVPRMYVSLWFYLAGILGLALTYAAGNVAAPVNGEKSYPWFAGAADAYLQAVGLQGIELFLLTMPLWGIAYHLLPALVARPLASYSLAIVHFWGLVVLGLAAAPRWLLYTSLPDWLQNLGVVFGLLLWMPAWGGLANLWSTRREADRAARRQPAVQFVTLALVFFALWTLEATLLSVKDFARVAQFNDWSLAHWQLGALGWGGLAVMAGLYWCVPRALGRELASPLLARVHLVLAVLGVLGVVVPGYLVGLTQHEMWQTLDTDGREMAFEFVESLQASRLLWAWQLFGGLLYAGGALLLLVNLLLTLLRGAVVSDVPGAVVAGAGGGPVVLGRPVLTGVSDMGLRLDALARLDWHRRWEEQPLRMAAWIVVGLVALPLIQALPLVAGGAGVERIATVAPYTPLEAHGRDLYLAHGCANCHTQTVRALVPETKRFGELSQAGEFRFDHPAVWGWRRVGPDLAREGARRDSLWHVMHFAHPAEVTAGSLMPAYPELLERKLDLSTLPARMQVLASLGAATDEQAQQAEKLARAQADELAAQIIREGGGVNFADREVIALVAYLQRLGTDLFATPEALPEPPAESRPLPPPTETAQGD